jgi:hypothetical protein
MFSAKDLLTTYHQAEQRQRAEQQYLALEKRRDKRKQADLDAGRLVRIRIDQDGEEPNVLLIPARVAAFVCRVLGAPAATRRDAVRFTFTTQGRLNAAYYPEREAYLATRALIAHARASVKKEQRRQRTHPTFQPHPHAA